MFFGTQYYRPPFPRKDVWERDIKHIKSLHFNVVKLWAVWNWIEKTPGSFDFTELDELVGLCKKYDLKVIINTIPEGAPYWTSGMEQSFYKTATGETLSYSGPANIPSAGWPGLCPDSEEALALMCNFIQKTAAHFADNETVVIIDVWNEPHLEPMFDYSGKLLCYCEHSKMRFREWLINKYGSIEALNRTWFRQYTAWEQIEPPKRFGTSADLIDWRRFWLFNLADWLKSKVQAARKGAPNKLIQTHAAFSGYMGAQNEGGLGNELGDEFLLAKEVDLFGLSSFPLWLMGEEHVFGHLINAEIIAEASRGQPFYQVELQGGAGKAGLLGGLVPSESDVRQWNWSVIAAGGKGVVYWQYAPEPAGMESPGFGLVNADGSDTPRSLSAGACAKQFNTQVLSKARRVLPQNAIYLSRSSDLLSYAAQEEKLYNHSFKGIYKLLTGSGIPVRFAHADYIDAIIAEGVRTLYLPLTLSLSDHEQAKLFEYVENGGTLLVEGCTGMYGENGEMDMHFAFLHSLFSMESVAIEAIKKGHTTAKALGIELGFGCMHYRQLFGKCSDECKVTAVFEDGKPAALERIIGKGKAIWLGGLVGAHYEAAADDQTRLFLSSFFASEGYACVEQLKANGTLFRLLEDDSNYYAVCVNHSDAQVECAVRMKNTAEVKALLGAKDGNILTIAK